MKIFFSASTKKFLKYKDNYFAIRDFVVSEGHVLTRDWLTPTYNSILKKARKWDMKKIYKEVMSALAEADLVIIEDTVQGFSTGHYITYALQRRKPTLVLWNKPKEKYFSEKFIQGIESEYLQISEYNKGNYKEVIAEFLKKYENAKVKNRFHLVLNEPERKYLDWASFRKKKSRTNFIREIIRKNLNEDEEYRKYLGKSK